MAAKRRHQHSNTADPPIGVKATKPRPEPSPPRSLDDLPPELLAEVFAYTPYLARLKALSLVCRRWRRVALQSVSELTFSAAGAAAHLTLQAQLALFPSLTALNVASCPAHFALPTSLRTLELSGRYLAAASEAAARRLATFLSARLPNLTALYLGSVREPHVPHVERFLAAHSAQLTGLLLAQPSAPLAQAVTRLAWPALRSLQLVDAPAALVGPLIAGAPALDRLFVECSAAEFGRLPPGLCLTSLTTLHITEGLLTDAARDRIHPLPRLRDFWSSEDALRNADTGDSAWHDFLDKALSFVAIKDGMWWEQLRAYAALRELWVMPMIGLPSDVPLPGLEHVHIGDAGALFPPQEGLLFAALLLRIYRGVRALTLWLAPADVGYFSDAMLDLAALAAERDVRLLTVHSPRHDPVPPPMPSAVQYGWLQLSVLPV